MAKGRAHECATLNRFRTEQRPFDDKSGSQYGYLNADADIRHHIERADRGRALVKIALPRTYAPACDLAASRKPALFATPMTPH
jgi:hypothetical protein